MFNVTITAVNGGFFLPYLKYFFYSQKYASVAFKICQTFVFLHNSPGKL